MKGITFSPLSIEAIFDDRKKQSRRIAIPQPEYSEGMGKWVFYPKNHPTVYADLIKLPEYSRYKTGETLYVKETFYVQGHWKKNGVTAKSGKQRWAFVESKGAVLFENTKPAAFKISRDKDYPEKTMWYKRNARFMPKRLARLFIKITKVRVEQVSSISHADARAEGVYPQPHRCLGFNTETTSHGELPWCPKESTGISDCHRCAFRMEWMRLHGPTHGPKAWDQWVFVYDFKRTLK